MTAAVLGTLIAVLLAGRMLFNIYPALKYRNYHAVVPEYVRWVRAQVPPDARIICKDDFIFYEHYGGFVTLKRPNPRGGDTTYLEVYRRELERLIAAGVPVYVSGVGLYSYDPGRVVSGYLKRYFDFHEVGRHPYEIWHTGELQTRVFEDPLYQVVLK